MKHNINLYQEDFKPKVDLLSAQIVLYTWASCFALVLILYLFSVQAISSIESDYDRLSNKVDIEQDQVDALEELAATHQQSASLLEKVSLQTKEISVKRRLMTALKDRDAKADYGFSTLMADLAEYGHRHIWLTDIQYKANHVVIKGATTNPAALPAWLSELGQSNYFNGKSLTDLKILASNDARFSVFEFSTAESAESEPLSNWFLPTSGAEK